MSESSPHPFNCCYFFAIARHPRQTQKSTHAPPSLGSHVRQDHTLSPLQVRKGRTTMCAYRCTHPLEKVVFKLSAERGGLPDDTACPSWTPPHRTYQVRRLFSQVYRPVYEVRIFICLLQQTVCGRRDDTRHQPPRRRHAESKTYSYSSRTSTIERRYIIGQDHLLQVQSAGPLQVQCGTWKTRICWHWACGRCRDVELCSFAHGDGDMRRP